MAKNSCFKILWIIFLVLGINGIYAAQETENVHKIRFAPQTNILALGFFDSVELRDITANELIAVIPSPFDGSQTQIDENFHITDLAFDSAGTQLAISYSGYDTSSYILVVNTLTGQILHSFMEGDGAFSLAWNPDGSQLAAKIQYGYGNPTRRRMLVWDISTGSQVASVDLGFDTTVLGLGWHSDGSQILSADIDNSIAIWDTSNWTIISSFLTDYRVIDVAWISDASKIIALDYQRTLYVWDSLTGELLHKLPNGLSEGNYHLALSPNDRIAINGGLDIVVWDISGNEPTSQIIPVTSPVSDTVWINNFELIYTDGNEYHVVNVSF